MTNYFESSKNLLFSMNDLQALRSIIRGYVALVRHTVPASFERSMRIYCLEELYRRFSGIPSDALEVTIPLTVAEVKALDEAINGFTGFVRQRVPVNRERNEVIGSLEGLRQHLAQMLA
jgi:uncharacterized protein Smg (DUF494 family)